MTMAPDRSLNPRAAERLQQLLERQDQGEELSPEERLEAESREVTMSGKNRTTDTLELLRRRYVDGDSDRPASLTEERRRAEVARQIYTLRKQAGPSQAELAERVGTTQSAVSRLEEADWEGERETLYVLENASLIRQIFRSLETHESGTGHQLAAEDLDEIDRL